MRKTKMARASALSEKDELRARIAELEKQAREFTHNATFLHLAAAYLVHLQGGPDEYATTIPESFIDSFNLLETEIGFATSPDRSLIVSRSTLTR
jgi:hypothetical protein